MLASQLFFQQKSERVVLAAGRKLGPFHPPIGTYSPIASHPQGPATGWTFITYSYTAAGTVHEALLAVAENTYKL